MINDADEGLASALDRVAHTYGVDRAAVALAWLLAHPAQILPVLGTNNLDRIRNLSKAGQVKIDRMTWFTLYTAAMGDDVP
ncbi:putative oxidoreductase [Sinorhizobium terangae]|nr:putative oxidoreductase [Sinorhizobium terangae]